MVVRNDVFQHPVSTAEQARDGVSLDAQRARITAWCAASGYELVALHADAGLSGKSAANRPALRAALNDACASKAALVVYSLSRLARSTKDALSISERLALATRFASSCAVAELRLAS
jgi:DNA invertase Pin-like site-specific DNA recombinase